MDDGAWRAQRDRDAEARVGAQVARLQAWPVWRRLVAGVLVGLGLSTGAACLLLLVALKDARAAATVAVATSLLLLVLAGVFAAAPGPFLRFWARGSMPRSDPAASPRWNIPG